MTPSPTISMVFPIYNEEGNIRPLYQRVKSVLDSTSATYEMVFVDDGSHDGSLPAVKEISESDPAVRFVSLSRNFGHQTALAAGLAFTQGQAVICMDADLQHPPELIPKLIRLWREGYDVVFTSKQRYVTLSSGRRALVKLAYWLLTKFSGLNLSFGQSDFRLMDRRVVNVLNNLPEHRKFLRGLVCWVGFRQTGIEYEVEQRHTGRSKYTVRSSFTLLIDGILAFSITPLRWSLAVGSAAALASIGYGVYVVVIGILNLLGMVVPLPPGWATITSLVVLLGGMQLIAIGLLSEYVGRIYEQVRGRPNYIVREHSEVQPYAVRKPELVGAGRS